MPVSAKLKASFSGPAEPGQTRKTMAIDLNKKVARKSAARIHEKSRTRRAILTLEPTAFVGVRLEGTRQTYRLDAEELYSVAVKIHETRIEKLAKTIAKNEGVKLRSARAKARKKMAEKLK